MPENIRNKFKEDTKINLKTKKKSKIANFSISRNYNKSFSFNAQKASRNSKNPSLEEN